MRKIERYFVYKFENYEFYRLAKTRADMMHHKYIDKAEMLKDYDPKNEDYKWVLQLKPKRIKKYGRFWKPSTPSSGSKKK